MDSREREVVDAALYWWRQHRPVAWTEREHLDNPTINCIGVTEKQLAFSCAVLAEARSGAPPSTPAPRGET